MRILIVLLLFLLNGCVTVQSRSDSQKGYAKKCFSKAFLIEYKHDETEYWQLPKETIELKTGDCEDKAFYLLYMLSERDIKNRIVVGYTLAENRGIKSSMPLHAWNEAEIDGETYVLDSTSNVFRKKADLKGYYEWDITQDKKAIDAYSEYIKYYIHKAKYYGYKKLPDSVTNSFFINE